MSKPAFEKLTDLQPDPENANEGTSRGLSAVEESIDKYGGGRSILTERKGRVLAGNKTLDRAVEAGLEPIFVHTTGKQLVVVVRDDLDLDDPKTAARARGLAYADNRASELGLKWSPEQIKKDLDEGLQLAPVFFTEAEISDILTGGKKTSHQGHTNPDDVPDEGTGTKVQPGDIYQLGPHRLMCGDSTKEADALLLMGEDRARLGINDPPYGVAYDGGATAKRKALKNDHKGTDIYRDALPNIVKFSEPRAPQYVFYAGSTELEVFPHFFGNGLEIRSCLIWRKNMAQFGALSAQYKLQHEHFVYLHRKGESPFWYGPNNEVSVWDVDRATKNEFHPTQKPVALIERAINNSSMIGNIVIDFFGGSGSTMIACQQTDRVCRMMEVDPKHCQTIIDRWQAFTKLEAVKL